MVAPHFTWQYSRATVSPVTLCTPVSSLLPDRDADAPPLISLCVGHSRLLRQWFTPVELSQPRTSTVPLAGLPYTGTGRLHRPIDNRTRRAGVPDARPASPKDDEYALSAPGSWVPVQHLHHQISVIFCIERSCCFLGVAISSQQVRKQPVMLG